jgi:MFS transporter, DHA2 family, methylenomycin A resistance protein
VKLLPNLRSNTAALAAAMFGFAVVTLDAQVTNVALPAIHRDLGGGLSGLQWVVTGYTLMFSALLLFGGTIADRIGSRAAYRNGVLLFVAASVACGLAPSLGVLIIARLVQGIGAALVTPTSLSLIREAYEDTDDRARAIGLWAVGGSIAAAAGPIVGGALAQANWRLIFFLNVPVGLAALTVLTRVAESPRRPARFDWLGQLTAVLGLAALTYGCIEGGSKGFGSAQIIAAFVVAAIAFVVFLQAQARGRHPMLPLTLFRSRPVAVTLGVAFITMAGFYGTVFLQSLYFQQQRGYSALETGLLFLPMTGLVAVTSSFVARVMHRFGRLAPIVGGQLGMIAGLVGLALLPVDAPVLEVAGLMILVGVGGAFTVPAIASLILDSAPGELAGTASGVLNTFRQMGGSLGVAVFGAIVNASAAFASGLRTSYVVTAALVGVTAAACLTLREKSRATHRVTNADGAEPST